LTKNGKWSDGSEGTSVIEELQSLTADYFEKAIIAILKGKNN